MGCYLCVGTGINVYKSDGVIGKESACSDQIASCMLCVNKHVAYSNKAHSIFA